ncbi:PAS domain-containing protein [Polyangium aurulentum]|uniref:PAS domain-containing protein n=1 Tax=Polyangium aurulentum TaxID=2567896 RepID=UPI0010ADE610|nr:PAS domain-containing protein [Polyangium aurulentum]UQA62027.1 PAS domain-containing protein [Polyangium aurulentum]
MTLSAFSAEQLANVIAACPMGLMVVLMDSPDEPDAWRVGYLNRAAEVHSGVVPEENIGKLHKEVYPAARERGYVDMFARVARTGTGESYHDMFYDDGRLAGEFQGHVERISPRSVAVWFENITKRRQTEANAARADMLAQEAQQRADLLAQLEAAHKKAQESLDTYDLIASAADEALWEIDFETPGEPLRAQSPCKFSPRFADLLGYEPGELPNTVGTFNQVIHPDDRAATTEAFVNMFRDPDSRMEIEYRAITKGGEIRYLLGTACARTDAQGRPRKVAGAIRDITRQKQSEKELRERLALIEQQRNLIEELSTPLLEVWDDVIALPIVGALDGRRAAITMQGLLNEIADKGVRFALVDLTGVEAIDAATAEHVVRIAQAVGLLGARAIITGIQPAVAQAIVELGLELSAIETRRNLRDGLRECLEITLRERAPTKGAPRGGLTDIARRTGKPA